MNKIPIQINKGAYIFIDEYGNTHTDLSKEGTFSHFIFAAFIFPSEKLEIAIRVRQQISKIYRQGSFIKSSRLSTSDKIGAINLLKELNPLIMILVVDKDRDKLKGKGFSYHDVFYKYFQNMLIQQMNTIYQDINIRVVADNHGSVEFMKSLKKYIETNLSTGSILFPEKQYLLADDKTEEPLLQLADLAANVAGNIFCLSHQNEEYKELYAAIQPYITVDFFPYESVYSQHSNTVFSEQINGQIYELAIKSVRNYLDNALYKENFIYRAILEHLILNFIIDKKRLVPTSELLNLARRTNPDFTEYQLRQAIANFRDNRALVMSLKGKHGYKLPSCASDVISFYNRFGNNLIPMLKRISFVDRLFREQSINDLNLLSQSEEYKTLKSLIAALDLKN